MTVASRKASLTELQNLKDTIFRQLDLLRGNVVAPTGDGGSGSGSGLAGEAIAPQGIGMSAEHAKRLEAAVKEVTDLGQRFEALHKLVAEMQTFTNALVPRAEVQDAVKAIVNEIKTMKGNTVTQAIFKDALRLKADIDEFNK